MQFELLIDVPGLGILKGLFQREGMFSLRLAEPVSCIALQDGYSQFAWVGPTDWQWRLSGPVRFSGPWRVGDTVTIEQLVLTPDLPTGPEIAVTTAAQVR